MSNKIYGDISSSGNIQINGSNTIREINGIHATDSGDITIPFYNKLYIDNMIVMCPISRVGTQDYLPINVSGSFVGASNYIGKNIYPVLIENDGTVVYLRPGTNGSSFGYYYCYIKNARSVNDLTPVLTTQKYTPTSFTSNHVLNSFVGSNAAQVLMMRTYNGTQNTYTISLTNGTLNRDAHQNTEFSASLISGTDPQYAMVHNGLVYIFCLDGYEYTSEMAITVYTISTSDVIAGTSSSLTKVSGFSGTNILNSSVTNSSNIKIAPTYFSSVQSDNSFYYIPSSSVYKVFNLFWGGNAGTLHAVGSGNNIRVAFVHAAEIVNQQALRRSLTAISLVFDVNTKAYTFDNTARGQVPASSDSAGNIVWNNQYQQYMENFSGTTTDTSLGKVPTYMCTNDGVQFTVLSRYVSDPFFSVSRGNLSNFTSVYDSWDVTKRKLDDIVLQTVSPVFGSAIGENLLRPTLINANKILMHCSGTYNNVNYDANTTAYTSLSGSNTGYTYNSISTGGTITGFAPNTNRGVLNYSDGRYLGCITIMNQDGSTKVYGSSFMEGFNNKYSALEMNQNDFSYAQQITIGTNVLSTLKANVLSSISLPNAVSISYCTLYYVPDTSYTKSYAVTAVMTNAPTGSTNAYYILSEVDVTISSNVVTSVSVSSSRILTRNLSAAGLSPSLIERTGGLIIAKYADFTYVGVPGVYAFDIFPNSYATLICKVDNSTKLITGTPLILSSGYNSSDGGTYEAGVMPGIGFGVFENGTITDNKTKLIFKNFGTTAAQFDTMVSNVAGTPVSRFVVASQDVAQGFIVYISQSVPVLINGAYYTIPPTTIDLNTIDSSPASKTFYVYVVESEGSAKYVLSTTLLSEEMWRIYIGSVVTGTSSISSVNIEKVSRFLTYRTSTTKRGSAIPTSTGVPSSTGTRWK